MTKKINFGFSARNPMGETQPILFAVRLVEPEDFEQMELELFYADVAEAFESYVQQQHMMAQMFSMDDSDYDF